MPIARVGVGLADVRGEADAESELVDQLRFGERVTVLAQAQGWLFVQAREDHYFGWVREPELVATDEVPASGVIRVALATLRDEPRADAHAIETLPAGTWVEPGERRGDFVAVGGDWPPGQASVPLRAAWVHVDDLAGAESLPRRMPAGEDLVATARTFLDVPYLWGGVSARGLDCSGFVQLAYRLCGVVLMRDADQQSTQGRHVEDAKRAGDLLFFGTPVDHVGLATGRGRMIHAPGGGRVVEQDVAARGVPVAVRRYLP